MILTLPLLDYRPLRIVSLVPSQTELLHYLGLEEEVIAITKFCIHPEEWHQRKIRIGGTKAIDIDKITALNPDLIIANKEENVKEQVESLAQLYPVWLTDVNNLEDACNMINDIGLLTSSTDKATVLVKEIESEFSKLPESHIPALYLIWKAPYMTVGGDTFINDMLHRAGFSNVYLSKKRYPEVNVQQMKASGCKIILLSSEPYPFSQKHVAELNEQLPGIKIILVDGEMFSWYGSRLIKAATYFKSLGSEVYASY